MEWVVEREAAGFGLRLEGKSQGDDLMVMLYGGEKPHIGSVCVSVPRESLKKDGSVSCTTSVVNLLGHKDEILGRMVSETLCVRYQTVTVCTCGVHIDHATKEQLDDIVMTVKRMLAKVSSTDQKL
jgi:hypothetical protein